MMGGGMVGPALRCAHASPVGMIHGMVARPSSSCVFCELMGSGESVRRLGSAAAIPDTFPASSGHTLVVPVRHVADFFALNAEEQADVWSLVAEVRMDLERWLAPDGYNVGLNAGSAAGQTVDHAHIHVIPRFLGDVPDPRGGVRWVLPATAAYWSDG
jgi:diadenosine tetraphosphate (Ap4A) HIT family hydrolase